MKQIWTLAKKELNYYLNSSIGFIVVVPFLLISFFLYFRTAFVFGVASLRPFFDLLPWFLIFLAPALTMHTLAEEKSRKTLELLIAHPLSEVRIVMAKFLGALFFYLIILATTLPLTIPLFIFSKVDLGVLVSQYLGAIFTGATFLSIGVFASSITSSLISSFLIGGVISFVLVLFGMDFVTLSVPNPLGTLLSFLSVTYHNQSISRGLLDLSDLLYFVTASTIFLIGAIFKISESKTLEKPTEKSKLYVSLAATLAVGILLNVATGSYPIRLDLTANKAFSLSKATKLSVSKIDDVLTIKTFISPDLPPSMQNVARETKDLLTDYARYSKKIKLESYSPTAGNDAEKQARDSGIFPVQFNTIGTSSYELKNGYLGIALRFGDKTEVLPFVQNTQNLEHQLTRRINKMVSKIRKKVSIFSGPATPQSNSPQNQNNLQFTKLNEQLGTQYEAGTISIDRTFETQKPDLLVLAGLSNPLDNAIVGTIKKYLENGGKALFLLDKVSSDPSNTNATSKTTGLENLMSDYGVVLNSDLVYDASLAETVQLSRGQNSFLVLYPYYFKSLPADNNFPPTSQIRSISLLWPSSLTLAPQGSYDIKTIIKTSKNAGTLTGSNYEISVDKLNETSFKPGGKELPLSALVSKKNGDAIFAVVTDSKFASDNYSSPNQNLNFALNLIDYLTLGPNEIVPVKGQSEDFFMFSAPWQPAAVQWGETIGIPLLVAFIAFYRLLRRKQGFNRTLV